MGAKSIGHNPGWRTAGKLLSVAEVSAISGWSFDVIRSLRKAGTLWAVLDKRPYRFDPEHIYQVLFEGQRPVLNGSVSSLKTEKTEFVGRKPLTKEDLWQEK